MKSIRSAFFLTLLIAGVSLSPSLQAQRTNLSAREALGMISVQYGPQATAWIAEMRAQGGIPQPSDWQILTYEERAPRLLYRFWAGGGRVGDGGADDQRYPDDVPVGFFTPQQITVDSVAAFTIAEGEARAARMAFDSCDYLLRLREYSNEPVWRLELFDASRRIVGKLYISGGNGEVLRTIWVYRDQRPDGQPTIIDSAAPGRGSAPAGFSQTTIIPSPSGSFSDTGTVVPGSVRQVPGSMSGIHSVPLPPAPGVAVNTPAPYAPVAPSGRVMSPATSDPGIPSPPPITPSAPVASAPSIPAPSAPTSTPAPAPTPSKPPVTSSSGGDSERIPPPPIPR